MSNDSNRKDDPSKGGSNQGSGQSGSREGGNQSGGNQSAPGAPQGDSQADDRHKGRPGERPETDPDKRREGGGSQTGERSAGNQGGTSKPH